MLTPKPLTWKALAYFTVVLLLLAARAARAWGLHTFGVQVPLEHLRASLEEGRILDITGKVMKITCKQVKRLLKALRKSRK